jgi:hypothetical protein
MYYIGYMVGDLGVLYPDVFEAPSFEHNVGKAWGGYVWVAGPFKFKSQAVRASKGVK